jgi:hypothetical protein
VSRDPKPLRRDQLEEFLKSPIAVRTFERIMARVLVEMPVEMLEFVTKSTLTTRGDLFVRGATDIERLALGASGRLLKSNGTDAFWAELSPVITLGVDLSGSVTLTDLASGTLNASIVNNAVTDGKLRDSAGLSVIGRSANSSGDPADIVGIDGQILRVSGSTLGFGSILSTSVSDFTEAAQDATGAMAANSARVTLTYVDGTPSLTADLVLASVGNTYLASMAQSRIKGRAEGAGTGDPTDLTPTQVVSIIDGEAVTWSAAHTFTNNVIVSGALPAWTLIESDQAADEQRARVAVNSRVFRLDFLNDVASLSANFLSATRASGATPVVTAMTFGNSTDNPTFGFSGTGTATFSGQVTALRFVPTSGTAATNGLYLVGANNPGLSANSTKVIDWTSTLVTITGNLSLGTAGNKLLVKEGSNAAMGVATLVGGTVTVSNTLVTASSRIFLSIQSLGTVAAPKAIGVTARTAATSFTITSADATDTSAVAWHIIEPA